MQDWWPLAAFLIVVLGGGLLIGFLTAPGPWYAELQKPSFNPPNWLFGPVWSLLYIFIAVVGWRVWRDGSLTTMRLWWAQLLLNFMWSPVFFALHWVGLALVVIAALLVVIVCFIVAAWHDEDRLSAGLFVPYACWVGFATLLNAAIFWLN